MSSYAHAYIRSQKLIHRAAGVERVIPKVIVQSNRYNYLPEALLCELFAHYIPVLEKCLFTLVLPVDLPAGVAQWIQGHS